MWMKKLAQHYEKMRSNYPEDQLIVLFDIDGTILDMRHMVLRVLYSYDQTHDTSYFDGLKLSDIDVHENQIESLLTRMRLLDGKVESILHWVTANLWTPKNPLEAHRPFSGVMEVMRWLQLQPDTCVGLNTGRPEYMRTETLHSLNQLGEEYKVSFTDELLYMSSYGWEASTGRPKVEGVRYYQALGYRVVAFIDNEPANLLAVSESDGNSEILLLHADTIFETELRNLPTSSVSGDHYDLAQLMDEKSLPKHIQLVWHGLNDRANLLQFLASDVQWGEVDVRLEPNSGELILRHDSFDRSPLRDGEDLLALDEALSPINALGKSIKLDIKERGPHLGRVIGLIGEYGFDDSRVWFNANIKELGENDFRRFASDFPSSVVQCPIDFVAPVIADFPDDAKRTLDELASWGITRFSMKWSTFNKRQVLDRIADWGYEINIYDVPDLESFLRAVLLSPTSVTSDFNFPQWHYFGRGSGENGSSYEYTPLDEIRASA